MKKTIKTEVVPIIDFLVNYNLPDFNAIVKEQDIQKQMFDRTLHAITVGIKRKRKSVKLFRISGTNKLLSLPKRGWKDALNNAMNFYSVPGIEDYNSAVRCRDLINAIA